MGCCSNDSKAKADREDERRNRSLRRDETDTDSEDERQRRRKEKKEKQRLSKGEKSTDRDEMDKIAHRQKGRLPLPSKSKTTNNSCCYRCWPCCSGRSSMDQTDLGDYEKFSAAEKLDHLWSLCLKDKGKSAKWPSLFGMFGLLTEDHTVTGEHTSDYFPDGRSKLLHSRGAIAKVVWETEKSKYTGMFKSANHGLIRASAAVAPTEGGCVSAPSYTPAIALKFLRDGKPSANFVAMYELAGQKSFNFFENPFSNHVSGHDLPQQVKALQAKFEKVSPNAGMIGLSEFAEVDEKGTIEQKPDFPFALYFQPNPKLTAAFSRNKDTDIANQFPRAFKGDEVLYRVYAVDGPRAEYADFVGTLKLDSPFIASKFADSGMFFKHTFFEKDLIQKPEWKGNYDPNGQGWLRMSQLVPDWRTKANGRDSHK